MLRRISVGFLLICILSGILPAQAEVERNAYLDVAFTCLEEGNPFLIRYNDMTGAQVEPMIPMGVPYFFGGQNANALFKVKKLTQKSTHGKVGDKQICGFDCIGFTRWIQQQLGEKPSPSLSSMVNEWYKYQDYRMDHLNDYTDFALLADQLQPGDFFVGKQQGRHILMYMGTLKDYGYTESTAGEMSHLLDYPLFINCGNDPRYIERTQRYIDENHLNCLPNKGGVTVTVIGPRSEDAPHLRQDGADDYYYYDVGGYFISVYDIHKCTSFVWWRTIESDKAAS